MRPLVGLRVGESSPGLHKTVDTPCSQWLCTPCSSQWLCTPCSMSIVIPMVVLDVMCECVSRKCDWENVGLCFVCTPLSTVSSVSSAPVCESCAQAQVVGLCAVFGVVCIVHHSWRVAHRWWGKWALPPPPPCSYSFNPWMIFFFKYIQGKHHKHERDVYKRPTLEYFFICHRR